MTRARTTPLWIALALSVLAHAATLGGKWLALPQDAPNPLPFTAHLLPLPPQPAVTPPQPRAVPKAAPQIVAAPATTQTDAPRVWPPPVLTPSDEPTDTSLADAVTQPEFTPPSPAQPEPVIVANAAPATNLFLPEPAQFRTLPRSGRIDYKFLISFSGLMTDIARTVQTWEATGNTYRIESRSETVGLARLAPIGPHEYQSSGRVTEHGLQPQRYLSQEERRGNISQSSAQFDWENNRLRYGRAGDQQNTALVAGSQDFVSFMFQLSLAPPAPGRITLPITNGRNFETYELEVLNEESIDSPMGMLRVLPIKRIPRPGEDGITVYLATEYRYLPVRIVHINRDGTPGGEVIATSIQVK